MSGVAEYHLPTRDGFLRKVHRPVQLSETERQDNLRDFMKIFAGENSTSEGVDPKQLERIDEFMVLSTNYMKRCAAINRGIELAKRITEAKRIRQELLNEEESKPTKTSKRNHNAITTQSQRNHNAKK